MFLEGEDGEEVNFAAYSVFNVKVVRNQFATILRYFSGKKIQESWDNLLKGDIKFFNQSTFVILKKYLKNYAA